MTPPESARDFERWASEIGACGARLHELRRFLSAELSPVESARMEAHIRSCEECRTRTRRIEREEDEFRRSTDVAKESAEILLRLERRGAPPLAALWDRLIASVRSEALRPALVGAIVLLLVVPIAVSNRDARIREKGSSSVTLEMFVNDSGRPRRAADGEVLREGDQIQFRYRASGRRYLFVVSVTSKGELSPLYPDRPAESVPVTPDGTHVLEGSIILDESRGPERIFAFFSDAPLPFDEVRNALEHRLGSERDITALHRIDLAREDVEEATLLIFKE